MKKEYERAEIEFILTDVSDDIITTSGPTAPSTGNKPIGGGGNDLSGWT